MQKLGIYAKERNIKLGIEILNRFETSFLNTAEQAIHLCEKIQNPNVGLHLDPFHMNIEEKDPLMAIKRAKGYSFHFHISENDRGIIGQGNINWKTSYVEWKVFKEQ